MSKVQVVWFRDLVRWDIKHYLTEFKSKFPLVHLKDYIAEKKQRIKPSNFPNETFDILGVNNKDGVYFNESLLGSRIKQPYYQVRSGEIFYNPYRVNVGSIGIVPPEFDLKYTSPAYVIFQTDETRLLSQYLVFVLKSAWFNEHLRAKTRGSVRQNLSFEALCDLQIPLPPLKIQKQIVAKIESIKAQIKALQEEEKRLKDEIEAYIYIALGLEKKQEAKRQKVFIVRFKDLDRWDTRHNQANQHAKTQIVFENLENLTTYMQRGKTPTYSTIKKYPVIAQKCVQWNGLEIQKALFINPNSLSSYTKERFLQDDDILLNSTGIGTLGRAIIYKSKDNPYNIAVADGHITVMRFDTQRILPQYFYHYFSSALIQDNIEEYATGSTKQKELSLTLIKNFKIPLPPLSVQEKIVAHIQKIESSIATTQEKAKALELELPHYIESTL